MNLYFDLDGTLLDVRARYRELHRRTIAALGGRPLPFRTYWRLKRQATPETDIGRQCGLSGRKAERYQRLRTGAIEAPDLLALDTTVIGALDALDCFTREGHRCLIVTARRDELELQRQLLRTGLTERTLAVLRVPGVRPAAEKAAAMAADLAAHPAAALVFGDTEVEIEAARHVSARSCGVLTGLRSRRLLAAARPTHIQTSVAYAGHLLDSNRDVLSLAKERAREVHP